MQVRQMKKIEEEKLKLQLENQEMQKVNEEFTLVYLRRPQLSRKITVPINLFKNLY